MVLKFYFGLSVIFDLTAGEACPEQHGGSGRPAASAGTAAVHRSGVSGIRPGIPEYGRENGRNPPAAGCIVHMYIS